LGAVGSYGGLTSVILASSRDVGHWGGIGVIREVQGAVERLWGYRGVKEGS